MAGLMAAIIRCVCSKKQKGYYTVIYVSAFNVSDKREIKFDGYSVGLGNNKALLCSWAIWLLIDLCNGPVRRRFLVNV